MYILGVSGQHHDAAAALICDGRVVAAVEEEKLTQFGRAGLDLSGGLPYESIRYCLRTAGIGIEDVDCVAYYSKPGNSTRRNLNFGVRQAYANALASIPRDIAGIKELREDLRTQGRSSRRVGWRPKLVPIDHQVAHAASAFYLSGFDRAAILVAGGIGDFVTIATGVGEGGAIRILDRIEFPTSLGWIYSIITGHIGFRQRQEHKTQWLSVYGEPEFLASFRDMVKTGKRGIPSINMDYLAPLGRLDPLSDRFHKRFGGLLRSSHRFPTEGSRQTAWASRGSPAALEAEALDKGSAVAAYRRNIACSLQCRLEEVIVAMSENLRARTGMDALCLAGGVAFNSLMNSRLAVQSGFKHIFVPPAPGNTGSGLGAALYTWRSRFQGRRTDALDNDYLGPEFSDQEIKSVLDNCKLSYGYLMTEERVIDETAELIIRGLIVGWFQGRAEFGPRSLGARSLLATPTQAFVAENLNRFVKHREDFRPFAVSVPEEDAGTFFEGCNGLSKFLQGVARVRKDKRSLIPSAWFGDGLARVHTVSKTANPLFFRLLKKLGERTGVPILLNTSFNLLGKAMVCTPRDAVQTFYCSGIDALAISRFMLSK
jgi:carbamoyltransferase